MKNKLYAFTALCDLPGKGAVRPIVGYNVAVSDDEAKGKALGMIEEKHNLPVISISVCHIPTEDFITCSCQEEYDLEEHF